MSKGQVTPGEHVPIKYPGMHEGQVLVNTEADLILRRNANVAEFFLIAHRGWWKSSFVMRRLLLFLKQGMPALWTAPTLKPITDFQENLLQKSIDRTRFEKFYNHTDKILRLPGCAPFAFSSLLEEDASRGGTPAFIANDEFPTLPNGTYESVIRPMRRKAQVAYRYSEVWNLGTPNKHDPKNHAYKKVQACLNSKKGRKAWVIGVNAEFDAERNTIRPLHNPYSNPFYKFEDLKDDYDTAENKNDWLVEWLCLFISSEGGQFEHDAIQSQCCLPFAERTVPIANTSNVKAPLSRDLIGKKFLTYQAPGLRVKADGWYQIGVDLGITTDRISIQVLDVEKMQMVYFHHFLPYGKDRWFLLYEAIAHVCRTFPGASCYVDSTGMGSNVEENMRRLYGIRVRGVNFNQNKEPMLNHAAHLLEDASVKLFDIPLLKDELGSMERKKSPTGRIKIAGAGDAHDDAPMAFALMVYGIFPPQGSDNVIAEARGVHAGPVSQFWSNPQQPDDALTEGQIVVWSPDDADLSTYAGQSLEYLPGSY